MNLFQRRVFTSGVTALFLFSCNSTPNAQDRLPHQTMQTALLNAALIESSKVELRHLSRDSIKARTQESYGYIYKKLSITPQQLRKSHEYYTQHPQEYMDILKVVLDSLKSMEKKYQPKPPEEEAKE